MSPRPARVARAVGALGLAAAIGWGLWVARLDAPVASTGASVAGGHGRVDFAEDVLPVLAANCLRCHGGVRERASLNLSDRARATSPLPSGRTAIVPGDTSSSELVARISSDDPDRRMPPDGAGLGPREVETIRRWVEQGAGWGTHWAFVPPEPPAAPPTAHDAWIRRPLDAFVLRGMRAVGVDPAPEADRATFARRAALDLTGLPPRPELRNAFLADPRPDAHARYVDALLADAAFGERFARAWLDLGRYADTQGYEKDNRREAWAWRDWVVEALNADMPVDRMAVRMLAGDLLPGATDADRVASAFHRNTLTNTEGGTDDEEFRMAAVFDRVSTTWQAFLGVTFQCVQCHGHPYDPIAHREYYAFLDYLNQTADSDRDDDAPRIAVERATVRTSVPVMQELPPSARRRTRVLDRGALTAPLDPVEPGVPAVFARGTAAPDGRLGMAEWVADARHPLFARVAANRAWETLFGRGIVETSEDFGVMGSGASDRALLDHLATMLVERGFSMKALLREIATSATYMQSAAASARTRSLDPDNRRWSRMPRVRLEAEQVRDQALAVSGLLSRRMGGPPVMPPQPEGVWQVVYSGDAWRTSAGQDRHRRAIYTFMRRSSPYPSFISFDATSRETCMVRRVRTNTPLAALVTLNDPVYVECAQALAASTSSERDDRRAVRTMLERALARTATDTEVGVLVDLVSGERIRYAAEPSRAAALAGPMGQGSADLAGAAARTAAANAILNLDEFLVRP